MSATAELPLPAELLLFAIDPKRGGLLKRHRRRFRRAMAAAGAIERGRKGRGWRVAARRTRRRALRELRAAGLVARRRGPRGPRLTDPTAPRQRFRPLREALLASDGEVSERDATLLLLVGYSRLLGHHLTKRSERRVAYRKLRRYVPLPHETGRLVESGIGVNQDALQFTGRGFLELLDQFDFGDIADYGSQGGGGDFGGGGDGGGGDGSGGGGD